MGYVANQLEYSKFEVLHRELRDSVERYPKQWNMWLSVPEDTWNPLSDIKTESGLRLQRREYFDFQINNELRIFNGTVVSILPPYAPSDVYVHDKKYHDLGVYLKDEIAKLWEFGTSYKAIGDNWQGIFEREIYNKVSQILSIEKSKSYRQHNILNKPVSVLSQLIDFGAEWKKSKPKDSKNRKLEELAIKEVDNERISEFLEAMN